MVFHDLQMGRKLGALVDGESSDEARSFLGCNVAKFLKTRWATSKTSTLTIRARFILMYGWPPNVDCAAETASVFGRGGYAQERYATRSRKWSDVTLQKLDVSV
ncbi:hypothetical protein HBI47_236990 [Parastagonospora nodorum]|nr:hypothetical protein HBI47_236990 [Parastagonospora nodorum]